MFDNRRGSPLKILVEVVSADLISETSSTKSFDVYCVCKLNSNEVHRTKTISNTKTPIWTIITDSLFILQTYSEHLKEAKGLTFDLMHGLGLLYWSPPGQRLGSVMVPYETILEQNSERLEFAVELSDISKKNGLKNVVLALRFRFATNEDQKFMVRHEASVRELIEMAAKEIDHFHDRQLANEDLMRTMRVLSFNHSRNLNNYFVDVHNNVRFGENQGKSFYVKPYPDPLRSSKKYLTKRELDDECLKPSRHWIQAGSGDLGYIHIEILKCDKIPAMDKFKTSSDPFVAFIFEDAYFRTDTIFNCVSPRWMPWTKRAFILPIVHPYSPLLIGVFDDDPGEPSHDNIGRVVVNPTSLHADTMYNLTYDLYPNPITRIEGPQGTLTIRLRIEWFEEKNITRIQPLPRFLINVPSQKDFKVLRYICRGEMNQEKATIANITDKVHEIMSYGRVIYLLIDAFIRVILWRGHVEIDMSKNNWISQVLKFIFNCDETDEEISIWFPIHSVFFFLGGITVAENLNLIPSFICFSMVWIMLTMSHNKSHHPNPWKKCKSFMDILKSVMNQPHIFQVKINPNENKEKSEEFEEMIRLKVDRLDRLLWGLLYSGLDYKRKYMKESADEIAIETEDKSWQLFENKLYYVYIPLHYCCMMLRKLGDLIGWQLPVDSFILTTNILVAGFLFLFIDWCYIVRWFLRLFFWTCGPWMKLIDIWIISSHYRSDRKLKETKKTSNLFFKALKDLFETESFRKRRKRTKIAHEDAQKLKDMRTYRFGEFSEVIPSTIPCQHQDIPRPESHCEPYIKDNIRIPPAQFHGQKLLGTMIHHRNIQLFTT